MNEMTAAGLPEWVLLLATLLLNSEVLIETLEHEPALWEPYEATLAQSSCIGYQELLAFLRGHFGEEEEEDEDEELPSIAPTRISFDEAAGMGDVPKLST